MSESREEKLARLKAARGGGVEAATKEKNTEALQKLKQKRLDEFQDSASGAGMDLSSLDPSIAAFLSKGMSAQEMIAARSANRAGDASSRAAAPPPPPKK
eukprot:m.119881 g.119881  ORF g.119881 m.119881 type:complete len:100 (+) comp13681_c0_seq2:52-351(+)